MTEQQLEKMIGIPIEKIRAYATDPDYLLIMLNAIYNAGILAGHHQADEAYNKMFRGYDETSINN